MAGSRPRSGERSERSLDAAERSRRMVVGATARQPCKLPSKLRASPPFPAGHRRDLDAGCAACFQHVRRRVMSNGFDASAVRVLVRVSVERSRQS